MPRPSNRGSVLEAACRVIETSGVGSLTLEAVAAEAKMTKAGVVYHFATMRNLMEAVHLHLAEAWESEMIAALGMDPEFATEAEKVRAYTRVTSRAASRVEVVLMAESGQDPALAAPWERIGERWAPITPKRSDAGTYDEADLQLLLGRLAADGLWGYEATTGKSIPADLRAELVRRILAMSGIEES